MKAKSRNVAISVSCEIDGSGHRHGDQLVENYLLCILHSASRLILCHKAVLERVKLDIYIVIFYCFKQNAIVRLVENQAREVIINSS